MSGAVITQRKPEPANKPSGYKAGGIHLHLLTVEYKLTAKYNFQTDTSWTSENILHTECR